MWMSQNGFLRFSHLLSSLLQFLKSLDACTVHHMLLWEKQRRSKWEKKSIYVVPSRRADRTLLIDFNCSRADTTTEMSNKSKRKSHELHVICLQIFAFAQYYLSRLEAGKPVAWQRWTHKDCRFWFMQGRHQFWSNNEHILW